MDNFLQEMLGGEGNKDARERFRGLWDVSSHVQTFRYRADEAGVRNTPNTRIETCQGKSPSISERTKKTKLT